MRIEDVRVMCDAPLQDVRGRIDGALRDAGALELGPVTFTDPPFDTVLGEDPDVAVAASRLGATGGWAVHAYVWDRGATREVLLHPLGDGRARALWNGRRGRAQTRASRRVVDRVAASLSDVGR